MNTRQTDTAAPVPTGPVLIGAGVFDIALGAGLYGFNPIGLEPWINAVVAGALVAGGVSVIGLGVWLKRRRQVEGGRPRLIE